MRFQLRTDEQNQRLCSCVLFLLCVCASFYICKYANWIAIREITYKFLHCRPKRQKKKKQWKNTQNVRKAKQKNIQKSKINGKNVRHRETEQQNKKKRITLHTRDHGEKERVNAYQPANAHSYSECLVTMCRLTEVSPLDSTHQFTITKIHSSLCQA